MSEEPWEWNEDDAPAELEDELEEGGFDAGNLDDDDVWGEGSEDEF